MIDVKPRQLKPAPEALRTEVVKEGKQYQELVNSLATNGWTSVINATPILNADGTPQFNEHAEEMYQIGDGFHRWTAAQELGMVTMPLLVLDKSERSILALQIANNAIRIETRKAEYAQALKQLVQHGETIAAVAAMVLKSESWVKDQLSLTNLPESIQKLIDDGQLNAVNAVTLAKLPSSEVEGFVQGALTKPVAVFQQEVDAFLKERRKALLAGRVIDRSFKPNPLPRKVSALKGLYDEVTTQGYSQTISRLLKGVTDPTEAAILMLKWTIQLDPDSVANQKLAYDAEEAKKSADKAKKEAEKKAKADAAIEAAKLATDATPAA